MKKIRQSLAEIPEFIYSFVAVCVISMVGWCALAVAITWFFLAAALSIINSFRGQTCKK